MQIEPIKATNLHMTKYVTYRNYGKDHGLSFKDLIGLTGIYGVHPELEKDWRKLKNGHHQRLEYIRYFNAYRRNNYINIEFETDKLKKLNREIALNLQIIENVSIESVRSGMGLSLPCLYTQVITARRLGYK